MAGQTINVSILADTKQFRSAMGELSGDGGLGKVGSAAKKLGGVLAGVFATQKIVGWTKDSINAASDLQQSIGGIDAVFKNSADQMHAWAADAATTVGLTKNEYNELGTLIGAQLKNGGTAMEDLAPKANDLIRLGADLASMFGGTTRDAVEALSSALKGERDPIEKYGVTLQQAAIDAEAARLGFEKVGGSLTAEANQAATLSLIMGQTTDAHGNFAKESDTFAGQAGRLKSHLGDLAAELGTHLLPALTDTATWLNDTAIPALKDFGSQAKDLWTILSGGKIEGGIFDENSGAADNLTKLRDTLIDVGEKVQPALDRLNDAAQNAYDTLTPILADIAAVFTKVFGEGEGDSITDLISKAGDLIAGYFTYIATTWNTAVTVITTIWNQFGDDILALIENALETIKGVISGAMDIITGIFETVSAILQGDWEGAWEGLKKIVDGALQIITSIIDSAMTQAKILMTAAWDAIKDAANTAWDKIKEGVTTGIENMLTHIREIPGKVTGALGNLSNVLLNAGGQLIDGFINGIKAGFERVKSKLGELTALLPSWKGPATRDANILKNAGQLVIAGFITGMESQYGAAQRSLTRLTTNLATTSLTLDTPTPQGTQNTHPHPHPQPAVFHLYDINNTLIGTLRGIAQHTTNNTIRTISRTATHSIPGGR